MNHISIIISLCDHTGIPFANHLDDVKMYKHGVIGIIRSELMLIMKHHHEFTKKL